MAAEGYALRRFAKGDKVLGPWISRHLPLAEVLEVYEAADGQQALLVSYIERPVPPTLYRAEVLDYVGDRKFLAYGEVIYRVSNGEVVASSVNWANIIADFLETFTPPFPGDAEAEVEDALQAHEKWRALHVE
jgi:hypothetical protein